ncbi:MAG: hypothetical protein HOP08_14310 [Cyclobacteriaceae bacterium]|nr:hypothetical protein [Cyclobacteriaceae bacterium]
MTLEEFNSSLNDAGPPEESGSLLKAMWWDKKGNWEGAHNLAQEIETKDGAWVHAYLHRKEGDVGNASYWYSKAGRKIFHGSSDLEWEEIIKALIQY